MLLGYNESKIPGQIAAQSVVAIIVYTSLYEQE